MHHCYTEVRWLSQLYHIAGNSERSASTTLFIQLTVGFVTETAYLTDALQLCFRSQHLLWTKHQTVYKHYVLSWKNVQRGTTTASVADKSLLALHVLYTQVYFAPIYLKI